MVVPAKLNTICAGLVVAVVADILLVAGCVRVPVDLRPENYPGWLPYCDVFAGIFASILSIFGLVLSSFELAEARGVKNRPLMTVNIVGIVLSCLPIMTSLIIPVLVAISN